MKQKIESLLTGLTNIEKIALLESLCKKYRRQNSILINKKINEKK